MAKPKKQTTKKPTSKKKSPTWFFNTNLHLAFIAILCFVLYANTLTHDYTQDDAIVITDNEYTLKGIAGIPDILRYDTFRGFFKEAGKAQLVSGGRYRPLTLVLFAIEVQLFGQNPFMGHLINILFYALTCMLLYILLLQLLSEQHKPIYAIFVALAATLLFAVHPIHTEAVANIKGRDEIIALLGALATAYFCWKAYKEKNNLSIIWAAIIFFLTLFSKENAITFLGVIPLIYVYFTNENWNISLKYVGPLVLSAIAFVAIRASIIGGGIGEPPLELMNNPYVKVVGNQYVPFDVSERLATIFYTLWKYIQLLFVPHPLTHDYYPRHIGIMSFSNPVALLGLLSHVGLLIYALIRLPKKDVVSFGILYYLGTLFIVSNILFPIGTNMAERLIFMPSVGFCLIIAVLLYRLGRISAKKKQLSVKQLYPVFGILGIVVLLFSIKTIDRNFDWKDNYTLFTTDVDVSVNSAKLQNSVGGELIASATKEKDETKKQAILREAIPHLNKAVEIHPNYKNAYLLLGNAHNYLKEYPKAVSFYEQALRIDPDYRDAIQNLALSYRDNQQFTEAVQQFEQLKTIALDPKSVDENIAFVYEEAGKYYGNQNQHQRALDYFKKAIPYTSDKSKYEYFVGLAYARMNNTTEAIRYMEQALQHTDSEENKGYINRSLGDIYKSIDPAKAQQYYQQAQ